MVLGAEATEVDDPAYAALLRGSCEVLRASAIDAHERPGAGHRMNEVRGGGDTSEGLAWAVGLKDISVDDLRLRSRPS
jgi:hypothetical protein